MPNRESNNWIEKIAKSNLMNLPPKYIALVTCVLVLASSSSIYINSSASCGTGQNSAIEYQYIGRAEYERINIGQSLAEIEAILGRGEEISKTETTTEVIWQNSDCSSITGFFEKGHLKSKQQNNLK